MSRFIVTTHPLNKKLGTTELTVNQHKYRFAPNEHGDSVAEIPFDEDYDAILSISAGYQPYESPDAPKKKAAAVKQAPTVRNAPYSKAPHKAPTSTSGKKRTEKAAATPRHTEVQQPAVDPAAG